MSPVIHMSNAESLSPATVEIFDGPHSIGVAEVAGNTWSLKTSVPLALGVHSLTARWGDKVSAPWIINVATADPEFNLPRPNVAEATAIEGDKERLNYYVVKDDIHIMIPDYNKAIGDTVKLYWFGRSVTLGSDIKTVTDPAQPLSFVISRYEVIDVIGANASSWYTVRRLPDMTDHVSAAVALIVDGHSYPILAPDIDSSHDTLIVATQTQFNENSTAAVRCIGGEDDSDIWSSQALTFGKNEQLEFPIDKDWRQRNNGKSVKFNTSIRVSRDEDPPYLYSRLLRIRTLKQNPA